MKIELNGVVSGYPTSTNLPRIDGLSTNPRDLGRHIDYFDTYAHVARITSIRLLFALASIYSLCIHQMDVITTFLNGDLDEEVYMKQLEDFILLGMSIKYVS